MNSKEAELLKILRAELPEREGSSPPAIVFHGVNGENYRDTESPSWYNLEEATQVYLYLLKLYKYGLKSDDIGIITPYQKQVNRYFKTILYYLLEKSPIFLLLYKKTTLSQLRYCKLEIYYWSQSLNYQKSAVWKDFRAKKGK